MTVKNTIVIAPEPKGTLKSIAAGVEISHREKTLVYVEHKWSDGSFQATVHNKGETTAIHDPEIFRMAQNFAHSYWRENKMPIPQYASAN